MARPTSYHQHGNSTIAGRAKVQQGDRHVTNHIHIAAAYLSLQDELDLPRLDPSRVSAELRQTHVPTHTQCSDVPSTTYGLRPGGRAGRHDESWQSGPRRKRSILTESEPSTKCPGSLTSGVNTTHDSISSAVAVHGQSQSIFLSNLLECIRMALNTVNVPHLQFAGLPRTLEEPSSPPFPESNDFARSEGSKLVPSPQQHRSTEQDLLILCIGVVTFLTGRNVSGTDLVQMIDRCQWDRLLPILTALLGFGIARYLYLGQLTSAPSIGDYIFLEDAYGRQRNVAMAVCEDWSILKTFLAVHYRDTCGRIGETLVNGGQYNLTLGSRRGQVLHDFEWSRARLKPGFRIVNSVYLDTEDAKCLICESRLMINMMGEFHWYVLTPKKITC